MNPMRCLSCLFAFFLLTCAQGWSQEDAETSFYLGGIQVGEFDQKSWTNAMTQSGMNTVEVTVYARQGNWDSDELWFEDEDQGALSQIRAAKHAHLNVVLVLRVALDHAYERNKFLWHGMILPKSKRMMNSWFKKYTLFVEKWSKIAEKEGVDVVAIGSEMNALVSTVPLTEQSPHYQFMLSDSAQRVLENRALNYKEEIGRDIWIQGYQHYDSLGLLIEDRIAANIAWARQITYAGQPDSLGLMNKRRADVEKRWRRLIRRARRHFSGKLTYAANFDNYFDVHFWNDMDFIGINAYFPLRAPGSEKIDTSALYKSLVQGWEGVFQSIASFRDEQEIEHVPLLFTELGYTKYAEATTEPWSGFGYSIVGEGANEKLIVWSEQEDAYLERAMAIEALHDVVKDYAINLQGLLYWKFTTMPSQLDIEPFAIHLNSENQENDPAVRSLRLFVE